MQLKETREALNKFAKFVIQQARTRLTKGVKKGGKRFSQNDTRKLYNSLEYLPFIDGDKIGVKFYMEDYGVPEILFYPSLIFELVFPILLIIGYQTRISAVAIFIFTIVVTVIFHNDFESQTQFMALLKNLSIAGGLLIIAANEPKICTLDYYLKSKQS